MRHYFHARCLAFTDSEHSGIHHCWSDGQVESTFTGMNLCNPRRILSVTLEQDVSALDEMSVCQSVVLGKVPKRGQSACWYRQTLVAVFGSRKMGMEKPAMTGEWSEFPTGGKYSYLPGR